MKRPTVSILVPAFRPQWLDTAIASALAQTHGDFELLVSDDSPGTEIEAVMAKWDDPRIRTMRNPRRGEPGSNRNHLIEQARGDWLKFLFDDDFLMPGSIESLLCAARDTGARLAFHARHLVDENGGVIASPMPIAAGQVTVLPPPVFFEQLIGACANPIGEPTNILVHAETLRSTHAPFGIDGRRMRFLTDVSLYTNFVAQGHVIAGIGYLGSAFRQHASQTSGTQYPGYSAGYYEWELLRRWSAEQGLLGASGFAEGQQRQNGLYRQWAPRYPELEAFIALDGAVENGSFLGPRFREAMSLADTTIEMRKLAQVQ
ncbi:MAG: glycosyltransferase [Pseudomonadota bacterium]|nr:glycosyltransferase [Pseudomonadota bacterium]